MDTRDGELSHLLIVFFYSFFLDHVDNNDKTDKGPNGEACSVRLPYSLVPGIDFSSSTYQRVLRTLAKQVHNDVKHEMVKCSKLAGAADAATMDLGTSPYSFCYF